MTNPSIPPFASFPVPPPVPQFEIVDGARKPTPAFQEWCQLMWAAIQGKFGLIDEVELAILLSGLDNGAIAQTTQSTVMQASELAFNAQLSAVKADLEDTKVIAWTALGGGTSTAATPTDTDNSNWVPTVDGAEPPSLITDGAGVLIFVYYTP